MNNYVDNITIKQLLKEKFKVEENLCKTLIVIEDEKEKSNSFEIEKSIINYLLKEKFKKRYEQSKNRTRTNYRTPRLED